jgi:hypothetical protein
MTILLYILYGMLVVACGAGLIILFRPKADLDYMQEYKNGMKVNSSTRIIFIAGNILVIWYVVYQVVNKLPIDSLAVTLIAGFANGTKLYQGYQNKKEKEDNPAP